MNYIHGEKFITLANNETIFYCPTNEVDLFFKQNMFEKPFILISHNGDGAIENVKSRYDGASLSEAPSTLVKWFAQNVRVIDNRMQSLPIGLENLKWFPELNKLEKIQKIFNTPKNIKNLVYANFNIETNPKERIHAYQVCQTLPYASTFFGKNGSNFDDYLFNIYNHDFVVCPPGNGEDTHRMWESLYVGSIPIVKKTINTRYYSELPICFVDDWNQLADLNFLLKEKELVKEKNNLKMLDFNYWQNMILKAATELRDNK